MCSASQTLRLFLGSTLTMVGLLGLWIYVNPDVDGFGVYLVKYIHNNNNNNNNNNNKNGTNASYVNNNKELSICKRNTAVDVYGDPGCPDNPNREHLCALFQAWTSACKEYGINYTLAFGSLLGAMRSKDVIPWDHDIDINIHVKYFPILKRWSEEQKFTKADGTIRLAIQPGPVQNIPEEKRTRHNCRGEVTSYMSDMCSFLEPMARLIRGSVFVDMFHFYEKGDLIEDPSENRLKQYKKTDFYPFRPCMFMGFNTSCPNRPWAILQNYFKTDNFKPTKMCKKGSWVNT